VLVRDGGGWRQQLRCSIAAVGSASAQEDQSSVVDEILRILRERDQITEEQEKKLRERAQQEQSGRLQAGIDRESLQPYLRSSDGNFGLTLGGMIHFDYQTGEDDERALTGQDIVGQFLVRRARLGATGEFFKWVGFRIEGDFTISLSLTDGFDGMLGYNFGYFNGSGQNTMDTSNEKMGAGRLTLFRRAGLVRAGLLGRALALGTGP
jgi:hypothetical protein